MRAEPCAPALGTAAGSARADAGSPSSRLRTTIRGFEPAGRTADRCARSGRIDPGARSEVGGAAASGAGGGMVSAAGRSKLSAAAFASASTSSMSMSKSPMSMSMDMSRSGPLDETSPKRALARRM